MTLLLALAVLGSAHAQDCSVKDLKKALAEASPVQVPTAFVKVASCDAAAGKAVAKEAFDRTLAGGEANEAAVAAIKVGAADEVRSWAAALEPDQRSRTIAHLGQVCNEEPEVATFFVGTHDALGEEFWKQRWHRGLSSCRTEPIQTLLTESLAGSEAGNTAADRQRFFSLLEVYARNLRAEAIPALAELATTLEDEEEVVYVVNAFADAANVGAEEGMDVDASAKAVAELRKIGDKLPPKAIDQARTTLRALGAEQASDEFAGFRWLDRKTDGKYLYAVVVVEDVMCKKERQQAWLHSATFTEGGRMWPEQIQPLLGEKLEYEWELGLASRCKGDGKVDVRMAPEPFASPDEAKAWIEEQRQDFDKKTGEYHKTWSTAHGSFEM